MAVLGENEGSPCQQRGQDNRLCWGSREASSTFQSVSSVPDPHSSVRDTGPKLADTFDAPGRANSLVFLADHQEPSAAPCTLKEFLLMNGKARGREKSS